jgi:hypothetical protein
MAADDDTPKRLAPKPEVLREIFLKSGNLCAFPGCSHIMMNSKGDFIGQICHIEGVRGERFRKGMSNEERAAAANLMLMCYQHHTETNDEAVYTVAVLQKMKADHEALFTNAGLQIYDAFVDRTSQIAGLRATTAKRLDRVLNWKTPEAEMKEIVDDINAIADRLESLDITARGFLCAVVTRAYKVRNTWNVQEKGGEWLLRWDDFTKSHDRTDDEAKKLLQALEAHNLAGHDEIDVGDNFTDAIALCATPINGWNLWSALAEFCDKAHEPLERLLVGLEFSRLDEAADHPDAK